MLQKLQYVAKIALRFDPVKEFSPPLATCRTRLGALVARALVPAASTLVSTLGVHSASLSPSIPPRLTMKLSNAKNGSSQGSSTCPPTRAPPPIRPLRLGRAGLQ